MRLESCYRQVLRRVFLSYWQSDQVAQQIAQAIERALQPPSAADKAA